VDKPSFGVPAELGPNSICINLLQIIILLYNTLHSFLVLKIVLLIILVFKREKVLI